MDRCKRGHKRTPNNSYLRPDGHRGCRLCRNERTRSYRLSRSDAQRQRVRETGRAWYRRNAPRVLDKQQRYAAKNKSRKAATDRAYRAKNKAHIAAYLAEWHQRNKERVRAAQRHYYQSHKERIKARTRQWSAVNAEAMRTYRKAWASRNVDKVRASSSAIARRRAELLPDAEVRRRIRQNTGIHVGAIPIALVEAKRIQLQLSRLIKEKSK